MLFLPRGPSSALLPVGPAELAFPAWQVAAAAVAAALAARTTRTAPTNPAQPPTRRREPLRLRFHCKRTGASYSSPSLIGMHSSPRPVVHGLGGLFPVSRGDIL